MKPVLFIGNLIALSFHHHIVIDAFVIPKVQQIHDRASSVLCHDFSDVSSSLFMQKGRRQYSFSSSKLHSSSPLTSSTKEEKMVSQFERRVSGMEKFLRLPVWPVWNGVTLFVLSKFLPNTTIAKLENQFGGRVCPNFFSETTQSTSPFIMLVHHTHTFTSFDPLRFFQQKFILPEGFPSHPHRGFITLTYCIKGGMIHRDSIGHKQTYGSEKRHGGKFAQWLVAGAGMLHEEMWDVNHEEDGWCSNQELFQLWVNLPAGDKMQNPSVCLLSDDENNSDDNDDSLESNGVEKYSCAPTITTEDGKVRTRILVGEYNSHLSTVPTHSPMSILHVSMEANTSWSMNIPASFRTAVIYTRQGTLNLSGEDIPSHHTAYLSPYGNTLKIKAGVDGGDFILLAGEPINEPVQARGSMVMNTIDEIDEAYNDYGRGLMGRPWDHNLKDDEWKDHVKKYPSNYR